MNVAHPGLILLYRYALRVRIVEHNEDTLSVSDEHTARVTTLVTSPKSIFYSPNGDEPEHVVHQLYTHYGSEHGCCWLVSRRLLMKTLS